MRLRLIIFALFFPFSGYAVGKDLLRLGYLDYPPLVYTKQENVPKGPVIDILEQILSDKFDIKWSKIPVGRVRWGFENRIIDAYPFLIRTKERETWIHFFEKPYLTVQNVICSKQDIDKPAENLKSFSDDMAGTTLVYPLNAGFKYSFLNDPRIDRINIEYTDYHDRSLKLLSKKRADYVFFSSRAGLESSKKNHNLSCVNVGDRLGVFFAIAKANPLASRIELMFSKLEIFSF